MTRHIKITLVKRGVSCVARLLDDEAPKTSAAVWDALPQEGQVYHGKYARNEIYNLVPAFADDEPGAEQQAALMLHGARDLLLKQHTMLANAIRGLAAEFGVCAPQGLCRVEE